MVKYDYNIIDPILESNLDITYQDFLEKSPIKISKWCFMARKKRLKGEPGYGNKFTSKNNKISTDTEGNIILKDGRKLSAVKIVSELFPATTKYKELLSVVNILVDEPLTTYDTLMKTNRIQISDSFFYQFRRKFLKLVGFEKRQKTNVHSSGKVVRKKNVLYQTIFQKEIGENFNLESLEILQEFINHLNTNRQHLEMVEITRPVHMIEIREISK